MYRYDISWAVIRTPQIDHLAKQVKPDWKPILEKIGIQFATDIDMRVVYTIYDNSEKLGKWEITNLEIKYADKLTALKFEIYHCDSVFSQNDTDILVGILDYIIKMVREYGSSITRIDVKDPLQFYINKIFN